MALFAVTVWQARWSGNKTGVTNRDLYSRDEVEPQASCPESAVPIALHYPGPVF